MRCSVIAFYLLVGSQASATALKRRQGPPLTQVGVNLGSDQGFVSDFLLDATTRNTISTNTGGTLFVDVEIVVPPNSPNPGIRCQLLNGADRLIGERGGNIDVTFADGNGGLWGLNPPSTVTDIICDPNFRPASPEQVAMTVELIDENGLVSNILNFPPGRRFEQPPNPIIFTGVTLTLGQQIANRNLICQALDFNNTPISMIRPGIDTAVIFFDNRGEFTFAIPTQISLVICDPAFEEPIFLEP